MNKTTFQFSEQQLDLLRELLLGDLGSLTELPEYDKREKCYQAEFSESYQLAEYLGADLGKLPKQLTATAKQASDRIAHEKAEMAELERTGLPRFLR